MRLVLLSLLLFSCEERTTPTTSEPLVVGDSAHRPGTVDFLTCYQRMEAVLAERYAASSKHCQSPVIPTERDIAKEATGYCERCGEQIGMIECEALNLPLATRVCR